jgi:hypothetical protein
MTNVIQIAGDDQSSILIREDRVANKVTGGNECNSRE